MRLHIIQEQTEVNHIFRLKEMYFDYLTQMSAYDNSLKNIDLKILADERVNVALESESTDCFTFCCDDEIIGFALVGQSPNSYCVDDIYIQDFYVEPKYRRIGVGEATIRRIADFYKKDLSFFVLFDNFPARVFLAVSMAELGYEDLARSGQITAPEADRYDADKFVFFYFKKKEKDV